jgi:mannose-6-phosphate isomerase-like protein (cupin superfamily)
MLSLQKLNEREEQPEPSIPGDVSARANADVPYTHRLRNLGTRTYEVIDVEFFRRPGHPSEKPAANVVAENPSARVYKWSLAAGGATTAHSHENPYVLLAVTSMRLKTIAPDGSSSTEEVKAGDCRWVDTRGVHTLMNTGSAEGQIVEIEMR